MAQPGELLWVKLVSDVASEPGGLPLLSTMLLELWRCRPVRDRLPPDRARVGRSSSSSPPATSRPPASEPCRPMREALAKIDETDDWVGDRWDEPL
jgi:hypothetical protein